MSSKGNCTLSRLGLVSFQMRSRIESFKRVYATGSWTWTPQHSALDEFL